jgi:uncharacterized protein YbgA (DUF1722 family)
MPPLARVRIGVSSCLLGRKVRYDGQHKRDDFLTETLDPFVEWVRGPLAEALATYGEGLMEALRVPATRGRHANVLQHAVGYFRELLPADDREELQGIVADYARGLLPLVVPLTLLCHHLRRHPVEWLTGQVCLDPDPRGLCLKNHA